MSLSTPELTLPRWLSFVEPVLTWYQLRRDLAALRAEVSDDADGRRACPA
ncbi:hypothetical protein [Xylanimonas allomyrinae]|nr:hypothetical protein [Xylanimonas allomyrinae]